MAIVVQEGPKTPRREETRAEIMMMIEDAVTSDDDIGPFEIADMILEHVESEMREARKIADRAAEGEVIEQFEEFGKNPAEYDPRAHCGNVRAILQQAFNEEWTGKAITRPDAA